MRQHSNEPNSANSAVKASPKALDTADNSATTSTAESEVTEVGVVFTPAGLHDKFAAGTTVLEAARALGVDLDSVCGGRGICGRCQVQLSTGSFSKWAVSVSEQALSEPTELELNYRGKRPLLSQHRLGCMAKLCSDAVIDVPADSQIHKQVVRKQLEIDDFELDPIYRLFYVELEPRAEEDAQSMDRRLIEQLISDWGLGAELKLNPALLTELYRAGDAMTVAVRTDTVVALWPGFVEHCLGVAIDVGSTTIAGHLCDLSSGEVLASAGRMNPQIRFGEDLMSRVSYVMMNQDGQAELTKAVREALADLIDELLAQLSASDQPPIDRTQILDLVIVGNPIMHHLVLGIDPTPLGQSPFPLASADAVNVSAAVIDLDLPYASVYVGPCIAGHVGADTAAAIAAEKPHQSEGTQLLIDVGTNAEIVLANGSAMFAASSPTGPAFEGAQISSGQRATAGAIERVRVDRETLEPRFKVIGSELWSNEDGFAESVAASGITGICGSGIIEVVAELFLAGVIDAQGVIQPQPDNHDNTAEKSAKGTTRIVEDGRTFSYRLSDNIMVTQADVRAIQLAKAALRAGIDLLLEHNLAAHANGSATHIDGIGLAGAFGAQIDPLYAMVIGLIPDCDLGGVSAVGNAAGVGAVRVLLSAAERAAMQQVVAEVTKIETATEERFQQLFVDALGFPHSTAPSPQLSQHVELPTRTPFTPTARNSRRRNRTRSS